MSNEFKVLEIDHLSNHVFRLRTERPNVAIKAGQCFSLGILNSGVNREYSMYSGSDDPYLDFLIRAVDGGRVSQGLQELAKDDFVEINGPYGDFCLNPSEAKNIQHLFIGSGTGIAPYRSFIRSYPDLKYKILHGIRYENEQYNSNEYYPDSYIPCVSRPRNISDSLRVTDYLKSHPVTASTKVYLCGNRNMIIDAFEILRNQGVPGNNIFTEVFF